MKSKFISSVFFGILWLAISFIFAVNWAKDISYIFSKVYVWWVILGIALLPGLLMSTMFFPNILNWKLKKYQNTAEDTTIIMCAHNEEKTIGNAIRKILEQEYKGHICLLVIDNNSVDRTKEEIK